LSRANINEYPYRPTVIFSEAHYQMWYESNRQSANSFYYIGHAVSEATDIAQIKLIKYRVLSSESIGGEVRLILEVEFKNFGPGKAQAASAKLNSAAPNLVISFAPCPIHLGDIEANHSVSGVVELKLNSPVPSNLADLALRWRVEYLDTVMGDRHFYET
jgi:hypothetical protein